MNSSTGIVSLVNLHGFDQTSSYLLNISVSDGVHASTTKLRVNLVSANSFTPTFDKNVYEVNFAENQAKGVQVLFISGKIQIVKKHLFNILNQSQVKCQNLQFYIHVE